MENIKTMTLKYIKYKYLFLMMLPGLSFYVVFHYVPIYGLQIAFKDYMFKLGIWGSPWIGFRNFTDLFFAESFRQVFRNTIVLSLYQLIFGFPAPIFFAIFLYEIRNVVFKKTIQTISYLPHFVSWVILGGLFLQFLSPSIGPINAVLRSLGMKPVYFLADPKWFRTVVVSTHIWKNVGWSSIVYLAALTGIDPELYNAGDMDGANRFQKIIYITLPSLIPVVTIMLIFSIGRIINDNFNQIFNLYNPSVYSVGDVISTYAYRMGLVKMQYSSAAAIELFKNIISFSLVVMANSVAKRINEYGIW